MGYVGTFDERMEEHGCVRADVRVDVRANPDAFICQCPTEGPSSLAVSPFRLVDCPLSSFPLA